ncbi:MAG: TIGR02099 family protein, partial [Ramlibacter sp.]|nr:TIGR02099 family protein [Ramlibacter sp.]
PGPRAAGERRRTAMKFRLDIADSGQLLARFGMKDVVRRGKGRMEGQVAWLGSPLSLNYPSLDGAFYVSVEGGQFLKAEPGLAKLLGVLSLQSLPRRLALDFRDVFTEGFAFDFVRGDVTIEDGIAATNNLQMKGVNAAVLMEGRADIARETQDLKVVVVPEIDAGTAALVATVINPAIGLGTFLAQLFLRQPLIRAATQEFHIDGTWADPRVTRVKRRPVTEGRTDAAAETQRAERIN